jgi:hypothetical protein
MRCIQQVRESPQQHRQLPQDSKLRHILKRKSMSMKVIFEPPKSTDRDDSETSTDLGQLDPVLVRLLISTSTITTTVRKRRQVASQWSDQAIYGKEVISGFYFCGYVMCM